MQKTNSLLEAERSSSVFVKAVFRILNGLAAGFSGFLVLFLVWTLSTPIVGPAFTGVSDSISPVFYLLFLILVFLGTFAASMVNTFMTCLTLKDDYNRMRVSLYHSFLFNIVFFVVFIVAYFLSLNVDFVVASYVVIAYVFTTSIASAILVELFGRFENILLRIYEVVIGGLLGWFLISMLYTLADQSVVILIFSGLPILYFSINFCIGLIDSVYYWLYKGYGIDFLSIKVSDTENEEVSEPKVEESKDVAGSDFINK